MNKLRRREYVAGGSDDSSRKRLLRQCGWALVAVVVFAVASAILTPKFSHKPPQSFSGVSNKASSGFKPTGDFAAASDTDLDDYYISSSSSPVQAIGEEPGAGNSAGFAPAAIKKVVVASIGKGKEAELDWVSQELPDWEAARYTFDGPDRLFEFDGPENQTVTQNKGRESNVYLTYIITHYHNLPDYMVFIHGKRYQSHNDDPMYDTVPEIDNLRLDYVSENGYTPLRCKWFEGCPGPEFRPKLGHKDGFWEVAGLYAQTFQALFPNVKIPDKVAAPCCAQFGVTREEVLKIPLRRWKEIRRYIYKTHFGLQAVESMKLGLVLEYMWHLIFGKPAIFCGQTAKECYCQKFGLCNLKCHRKDRCEGRWKSPPAHKMPEGWPDKGQGKGGWPRYGWWNDAK